MCNQPDPRRECVEPDTLCATHMPNVRVVRVLPMAAYTRLVAAPANVTHTSRFHLSGMPRPLRGYRIA